MNAKFHSVIRRTLAVGIFLSLYVTANLVLAPVKTAQAAGLYAGETPVPQTTEVPTKAPSTVNDQGNVPVSTTGGKLTSGGGFDVVNKIVFTIVKVVIGFMYLIMILAFIVGSVKNASFSIVAQKFGMANMMSTELMNLVGGVILFLVGLATLPAVNWVIEEAAGLINGIIITVPNIDPSIVIGK
jgi:uncharacterized integral membrane protein